MIFFFSLYVVFKIKGIHDIIYHVVEGDKLNYKVKINEFEGPLDLLLHLVKISNIDIYDININEITDQYFDYINQMEELNINVASEYLVMAASLMEIKSKSLLPHQKSEEIEENDDDTTTRENLIEKLVEYQRYKDITKDFKKLEATRREIYTKAPSKLNEITERKLIKDPNVTIDTLIQAWEEFLKRKNMEKPIITKITSKEYSVRRRKSDIIFLLKEKKKAEFGELFDIYNKSYVVVTFMSILELAKEEKVNLTQENSFDKIYIELKVN